MGRVARGHACEILAADRDERASGETPRLLRLRERLQATPPARFVMSPGVTFASAALVAALLALAFAAGRRSPLADEATQQATDVLDEFRDVPTVSYEQLQVDRGEHN